MSQFQWMGAWTCCHEAILERRSPTTRSSPVDLSAKSSSSSLDSPSSSLVSSSSVSGAWADFILKLLTASFADMPKLSAFDLRRHLQIGQALMSGRLHSRWKECPQPRKMRHKGLSRLQSTLSHLLCQWKSKVYIKNIYFILLILIYTFISEHQNIMSVNRRFIYLL